MRAAEHEATIDGQAITSIAGNIRLPAASLFWEMRKRNGASLSMLRALAAQDYPRVEFWILDRTNEAGAFPEYEADPRFRFVRDAHQELTATTRTSSAPFLCILDEGNLPPPDFLSRHIQLHLALPWPVAVTFEGTHLPKDAMTMEFSGMDSRIEIGTPSKTQHAALVHTSAVLDPARVNWLNQSSRFCVYRRAALDIICAASTLPAGIALNTILLPFCHLVGGSAIIAAAASGMPNAEAARPRELQLASISMLLAGAAIFSNAAKFRYWRSLATLTRGEEQLTQPAFRQPDIVRTIADQLPALVSHFGPRNLVNNLIFVAGHRSARAIFLFIPSTLTPILLWHLARARLRSMLKKKSGSWTQG